MSLILNGTDGLSDVDGSASTPAIRGTDTNTGIFFPAADTIAFAEGGAEVARFDSNGNFGLGTTAPIAKLDVIGSTGVTSFTGTTRLGVTVRGSTSTSDYSGIDFTGASFHGPTARVAVLSGASGSSLQFGTSNAYASGITNTAMTLDSSGSLLVGTTSNTENARLFVNYPNASSGGSAPIGTQVDTTAGSRAIAFRNPNGLVGTISTSGSSTAYNTSSDYRLKEDIQPMTGALAKVSALKPVTYTWKTDGSDGQGFIAHELAEVVPDCVTGEKDAVDSDGNPVYQGIDVSFLVATLTAAIQELKAELDTVKTELATLKGTA
jgi:hypothetical protein